MPAVRGVSLGPWHGLVVMTGALPRGLSGGLVKSTLKSSSALMTLQKWPSPVWGGDPRCTKAEGMEGGLGHGRGASGQDVLAPSAGASPCLPARVSG